MSEIAEKLEFAVDIAREAGEVALRYFRRCDLVVESKADHSPVTIADRSAEELLRQRIGERFPDDAILGEEFGEQRGKNDFQWILDPIDGTKSFIHGVPLYTTLIAVLQKGEPLIGVIHAPALCETVYAANGAGCWYICGSMSKPQSARVSNVAKLSEGLLLTSEIEGFRENRRSDAINIFMRLQRSARVARTWGDGYGYLMVATGRAEVMIDPITNLWDAAPLLPIIQEAGGHFSDWTGDPTIRAGEALATNACVKDEVLAIIKS
ncbi:MAG TPA: histidinol-phosphatase [Lacipirellulaceae bacterium]|nr:histidinol-phosphatase [Lacipirellulaceae bacterium]